MIKKIAIRSVYILLMLGVLVLLGFVGESNQSKPCKGFQVNVASEAGLRFIDSASVVRQVYATMSPIEGKSLKSISLNRIEELVNAMYYVEESRVFRTLDGLIVANITQRVPIARVINAMNETYYIDDKGKLMKPTHAYSARVVVVSGNINTRYSPSVNIRELENENGLSTQERVLVEIDRLVRYIDKDDFLRVWIDQIYVNRHGEFELVPRNGVHTIEFGRAEDMEAKFTKLMKFYKHGLTHVGWGNYKRINVKFKNQVVCSK
jgi:cell division protein FtsQ